MGKDKRLKIQLLELSESKKTFHYKILNGECNGIFIDIMKRVGGFLAVDKSYKDNVISPKLWIVVHPVSEFLSGGQNILPNSFPLAQDLLKATYNEKDEIIPVVHITTTTLFLPSLYTMAPLHRYVPRYHLIIDNSIWNYHVSIFEPYEVILLQDDPNTDFSNMRSFRESFIEALASIKNNYQRYLYGLEVAREYADLNARMTSQAFLKGTHAKGVSPFVFHSESAVKLMIKNEFVGEGKVINKIKKQKWRILLLDDKAKTKMGCIPSLTPPEDDMFVGGNGKLPWNCKLAIIEKVLSHCLGWDNENDKKKIGHLSCNDQGQVSKECMILIEYAQKIEDAEIAIQNKKYDIVLLDYLLDGTNGIHYGYEILNEIYKDQYRHKKYKVELKYKTIKPHRNQRMYGMFISAYSSAVHDQLLAEGINLSEKFWYINLGACPTNTPQLFLYNLIKLMDKRIEDAHIGRLSVDGIIDILEKIYDGAKSVRENAGDFYEKIQSYQYYYRNLLQDYDISVGEDNLFEAKGSVLVTHFLHKHINMGGLLEHLAQLVHLTAFGTVRQWPDMWEEYLYVKAQLDALVAKENKELQNKNSQLCNEIEKFIGKLKSSSL